MEMPALSISLSEQRKREYSFAFFRSVAFCRHWECVSEIRRLRTATERSTCWWMNTITSQTPARMPCCHLFSEECNLNKGGVWRGWESKNCEKLISIGLCLFLLDGISASRIEGILHMWISKYSPSQQQHSPALLDWRENLLTPAYNIQ